MKQTYLKSFCARCLTLLVLALLSTNLAWGETKTASWDLTSSSENWTATGNETYFSQPYGFKKANGTLVNKSVADFTTCASGGNTISSIKVGFKGLRNGDTASKITISLVDKDGNILISGNELELTNGNAASKTAYVYSTFTTGFTGATGFMMKVTTFGKNVLINESSYEITYEADENQVKTPTITPSEEKDTYFDPITVTLGCETAGAEIHYTTNGDTPTSESTLYNNEPFTVSATTTIKAIATKSGMTNSSVASQKFTFGPIYNSLADLVAAEIESGTIVKVSFENAEITGLYTNAQGKRYGVYLNTKKDDKNIEIYCTKAEHSDTWELHGTLSGTLEGAWKEYEGTWEICPDSWDDLTYKAPSKPNPTIAADCNSLLKVGESDEYTVTYSGDGTLSITSSDTEVAEAIIDGSKKVTITAKKFGTTKITISAPETANCYEAKNEYTLTVIAPASLPFAFDGGKADIETTAGMSQTGLGGDYDGSSPKLKFDSTGDYLVIGFNEQADYVSYDIKGNSFKDGKFEVMESADGEEYTLVESYTTLGNTTVNKLNALKSVTRYVKFVYTSKSSGNVALGNINIGKAYKATITDAKYATLGLPYAVEIPDGVSAYTATVEGTTVTMTKISAIPANCGVILYAETPGDYTFTQTLPPNLAVTNKLVAVIDETYTCGDDYGKDYYLGLSNGQATFKKLNAGGTIAAGKAYLKLDAALPADAKLEVTFGEPTGINTIDNEQLTIDNSKAYNLNGMRVNGSYKGIVIMNGKKYINK